MEGIRMVDEWPIIEKKIPSMDIVFRPVVDPALIEVGGGRTDERAGRPAPSARGQLLEQDPPHARGGADLPQGGRDAHGAGHHRRHRPRRVRRLPHLFDLLNRNIIATVGPRARAQAVEDARRRASPPPLPATSWPRSWSLLAAGRRASRSSRTPVRGDGPRRRPRWQLPRLLLENVSHTRLQRLDRGVQAHHLLHGRPAAHAGGPRGGRAWWTRATSRIPGRGRTTTRLPGGNGYLLSAVDDAGKNAPGTVIERACPEPGARRGDVSWNRSGSTNAGAASAGRAPAVTVGNFDGVHRGHQALVAAAVRGRAGHGRRAVALTFDPHPRACPEPGPRPRGPHDRSTRRRSCWPRWAWTGWRVLPFTAELSRRTPPELRARGPARRALGARCVVVGTNFRFGRGRGGRRRAPAAAGRASWASTCVAVEPGLARGRAHQQHAHPRGARRGVRWARPATCWAGPSSWTETSCRARAAGGRSASPPRTSRCERDPAAPGVYAATCRLLPGGAAPAPRWSTWAAGRPSGAARRTVEAHLLDFGGDLYGARCAWSSGSGCATSRRFAGRRRSWGRSGRTSTPRAGPRRGGRRPGEALRDRL